MSADSFLHLPDSVLAGMGITTGEIADAIEEALHQQAEGTLHAAPKSAVLPGAGRYMMATLAVGDGPGLTVVKTVAVCPDNPNLGLPAINGAILALDAKTGLLRALVGANWITAVRTAALSLVAARRLADPASARVAFVGTGVQALSHLDAFAEAFPLREVAISGRGQANIDRLAEKARGMGLKAEVADTPRAALEGADLVVSSITLDYTVKPFLDARWLKPGAFAAITDLGIPWDDAGQGAFARVVIDDREQEAASEKPLAPGDLVTADLGEMVTGAVPVTPTRDAPSAFVFRGHAIGDFAATALVVARAEATGAGQAISA